MELEVLVRQMVWEAFLGAEHRGAAEELQTWIPTATQGLFQPPSEQLRGFQHQLHKVRWLLCLQLFQEEIKAAWEETGGAE